MFPKELSSTWKENLLQPETSQICHRVGGPRSLPPDKIGTLSHHHWETDLLMVISHIAITMVLYDCTKLYFLHMHNAENSTITETWLIVITAAELRNDVCAGQRHTADCFEANGGYIRYWIVRLNSIPFSSKPINPNIFQLCTFFPLCIKDIPKPNSHDQWYRIPPPNSTK